ncbi:prenyltransferase [uncultured Rhodoblastus sp.]|uniref:prenyltransferase n=1 Tax=uncultured Rhodoblastus sp. TaxID=543037 RepID=UPI0025D0B0C1|nr:prenyltransferase [uncultured Rhodoblastus sp.]
MSIPTHIPLPGEPTPAALANPVLRYVMATRPAFLSVTAVGVLIGFASAHADGAPFSAAAAALTLLFALVAHAGANVINDYYDDVSGCDAANRERLFPFTGGSRFIQNGVLTPQEVKRFGYALILAVIPPGFWLAAHSAPGLLAIGAAGLGAAWAYSAPPFKLQARGLGEFGIVAAWTLVVVGADFVERGHFAFLPVAAGLGFALLVANVLYINQFPDLRADAQCGKRTLVVRLGAAKARWGYAAIGTLAYVWPLAMILAGRLPAATLVSLLAAPATLKATRVLWGSADQPRALAPALAMTIVAANLHGVLMAAALAIFGTMR